MKTLRRRLPRAIDVIAQQDSFAQRANRATVKAFVDARRCRHAALTESLKKRLSIGRPSLPVLLSKQPLDVVKDDLAELLAIRQGKDNCLGSFVCTHCGFGRPSGSPLFRVYTTTGREVKWRETL